LSNLLASAQARGDLDAVLAYRGERQRFAADPTPPRESASSPGTLRKLQDIFRETWDGYTLDEARDLVEVAERYREVLKELEAQAVREDDIPTALAARKAVDALDEDPVAERARRQIERLASPRRDDDATAESGRHALPAHRSAEVGAPRSPPAKGVYPHNAAPAFDGRRQPLRFPSDAARANATRFSMDLELKEDRETLEPVRLGVEAGSVTTETTVETVRPRLRLRAGPDVDRAGAILVFEYFGRNEESGEKSLVAVEKIPLPELHEGIRLVIDGQGTVLEAHEHLFESFDGYRAESERGERFAGVIVSIFSSDGKLLAQQTNDTALSRFASTAPP
jgi:hypothetical protein